MPLHMETSALDRIVMIVARGHVTAEQILETANSLIAANVSGYSKIIDVSAASSDVSEADVARIAGLLRGGPEQPVRGPVAFVVDPSRKGGFADAFAEATEDDRPVKLFKSIHDVRRWLTQQRPMRGDGHLLLHR